MLFYLKIKYLGIGILLKFYEKYIFRKLRLQSYRNTKKSEQKMLNNFKHIWLMNLEPVVDVPNVKYVFIHV